MQLDFLSTWSFWLGSSVVASTLTVKLAPEYSLCRSISWTALIIFAAQWLVYGVYAVLIYPHYISPLRHLPGPKQGNDLLHGQFYNIVNEPSGHPLRKWVNDIPNDGLIRYRHLWNHDRLLITSPKALAEVLVTKNYDFVKPAMVRRSIGRILGIGILFAEGDEHKVQRRSLAPAFNFRHIKELYPIFWAKSREMVKCIEDETTKQALQPKVEVGEWASRATLDIIGVGGLGQDFNALARPNSDLNQTYRTVFQPNRTAQILGLLQFFLPTWIIQNLPVKHNDNINTASRLARDTSRRLVEKKKLTLARKEKLSPDIISVALESGSFTEDQLVDNMMTFLAAGHETTASAFTWATYLLCQHADVQTKLRAEVRSHVASFEAEVDSNVIDGMPYLNAVCQEVLRFYAPVPVTLRDTAVDTSILGQFVPRGTKIILSPGAINFSKDLWGEDADQFKPDRWMGMGRANSGGARSNYSFMTFLHGPRSCIGSKFATAELACLLAAFVGRFEFVQTNPEEAITIKSGITARPRDGMHVNIKMLGDW